MKNKRNDEEISKLFNDPDKLTIIIQSGIREALLKHKQAGNPICEWKDNKVVWISAENIPILKSSKK
jgi:hypothetical protein